MLKAILNFFKKIFIKRVTFIGRGGLNFSSTDGNTYFIDSELLSIKEFDIIVFSDSVEKLSSNSVLNGIQKQEIIAELEEELKRMGLKIKFE